MPDRQARLNPFSLYPLSLKDALRDLYAVGPRPSKATPAQGHQKRPLTTRKANTAKAKRKRKQ